MNGRHSVHSFSVAWWSAPDDTGDVDLIEQRITAFAEFVRPSIQSSAYDPDGLIFAADQVDQDALEHVRHSRIIKGDPRRRHCDPRAFIYFSPYASVSTIAKLTGFTGPALSIQARSPVRAGIQEAEVLLHSDLATTVLVAGSVSASISVRAWFTLVIRRAPEEQGAADGSIMSHVGPGPEHAPREAGTEPARAAPVLIPSIMLDFGSCGLLLKDAE